MRHLLFSILVLILSFVNLAVASPQQIPLIAGQHIPVGVVEVTNSDSELVVTYKTDTGWLITETHVDVATDYSGLHTTKKGNPKPGKFLFSTNQGNAVNEVIYRIPLSMWPEAEDLVIATHAVVESSTANETAWAGDIDFPGRNWATYFMYTLQVVDPPGELSFSADMFSAEEKPRGFSLSVPIVRQLGNSGKISVRVKTIDGTATAGADYVSVDSVLDFEDQETQKSVNVIILNDNDIDPDETITVELSESCCLGEPTSATITIQDDESDN